MSSTKCLVRKCTLRRQHLPKKQMHRTFDVRTSFVAIVILIPSIHQRSERRHKRAKHTWKGGVRKEYQWEQQPLTDNKELQ